MKRELFKAEGCNCKLEREREREMGPIVCGVKLGAR